MKNTIDRVLNSNYKEDKASYQSDHVIFSIEDRLLSLKTQEITDELKQIIIFIKALEELWLESQKTLENINIILSKLHSRDRDYGYTDIIHVLAKYLSGVREFSSNRSLESIVHYKKLFETTLVAMMEEIENIENNYLTTS